MHHVAIDLGSRKSQFCIRSSDGAVLKQGKIATSALRNLFSELPSDSRVILETCSESFTVADWALAVGLQVRVVPATLAPSLGVGHRGVKNDVKDARALSEASCRMELPSVHIPSIVARERKTFCKHRQLLVSMRTMGVNAVKSYLRTQVLQVKATPDTLPRRVRELLSSDPSGVSEHLERLLQTLESLNKQIAAADKELKKIAEADEVTRRLMTTPGVGPQTAVRFVAAVDDVKRFSSAQAISSYFGLTPGEHSSGQREHMTGITKAGDSGVRFCLVQAAWTVMRKTPETDMGRWARQLAERRNSSIAALGLARKLSGILFALWRDGTTYEASPGRTEPLTS